MLIRESRLRELVRQLLREGGGGESVDLELSEEEVKSALDDLDLTDDVTLAQSLRDFEAVDAAHVHRRNLEMTTRYLLKMKMKSPEKFKQLVKRWVQEQEGGGDKVGGKVPPYNQSVTFSLDLKQWMNALESEELLKRLRSSSGNIDSPGYTDVSYQLLKNEGWVLFAGWCFWLAIKAREISTDSYKIADPKKRRRVER